MLPGKADRWRSKRNAIMIFIILVEFGEPWPGPALCQPPCRRSWSYTSQGLYTLLLHAQCFSGESWGMEKAGDLWSIRGGAKIWQMSDPKVGAFNSILLTQFVTEEGIIPSWLRGPQETQDQVQTFCNECMVGFSDHLSVLLSIKPGHLLKCIILLFKSEWPTIGYPIAIRWEMVIL